MEGTKPNEKYEPLLAYCLLTFCSTQTSGRKSTSGAGFIGQEIVAGRSVGDCSRTVSGFSVQIFVMSMDPFGRTGVRGVAVVTGSTLVTISV
jgi:hypothetical protein